MNNIKKILVAFFFTMAFLASGCSALKPNNSQPEISGDITTKKISAVENQPEETPLYSASPNGGTQAGSISDIPPELPVPYPAAQTENPEALKKFKAAIISAESAMSIMSGADTLIPLEGAEENGYRRISSDYAKDMNALIERMYEGIKYSFWEDCFGQEIEKILPEYVKESALGLMLKTKTKPENVVIETESAVISKLYENTAEVKALGRSNESYIQRTYNMLNGVRGWVISGFSDKKVTGDIALFNNLLIEEHNTLDKIFGTVKLIKDAGGDINPQLVTIENDPYGHGFYNAFEIEPFMTIEDMKRFISDIFTKEIAESYIGLYINRTYIEKDGKLYIISGALLPRLGSFSLEDYEVRSMSRYDITAFVKWTGESEALKLPITVAYENGKWKIDTRLPMMEDKIIDGRGL